MKMNRVESEYWIAKSVETEYLIEEQFKSKEDAIRAVDAFRQEENNTEAFYLILVYHVEKYKKNGEFLKSGHFETVQEIY